MRFSNFIIFLLFFVAFSACKQNENIGTNSSDRELSQEFKDYWFAGKAEITSYKLDQSRYGEQREGTAVLIFVTEDFNTVKQVKANKISSKTSPVLKLNSVKKFTTGIYPYSIMESTFYSLTKKEHAVKVTASTQEWCGQMYAQLNNKSQFEISSHTYFEGSADIDLILAETWLENEIWTQLRIDPDKLPTGDIEIMPSLEYLLLNHKTIKPYSAFAEFYQKDKLTVYKINYPGLKRNLKIYFKNQFPYGIEKWEETLIINNEEFTTSAIKLKTIKSDYWNKNSNKDLPLRDTLNLD